MSLETKSQTLKDLVSTYDTQWLLGDLSGLMKSIAEGRAHDQLGKLSSPLRQLYFLGGLLVSSDPANGIDIRYTPEKWSQIVELLNEIEKEYDKLFFPTKPEEVDEQWKHVRKVAMPSFLSYFNQGPLNFEEQTINWTSDLFSQLDSIIEPAIALKTIDFIRFYENIDQLHQRNFQSHSLNHELLRPNWGQYTKIVMGTPPGVPDFIREMGEKNRPLYTFMSDHGIIDRFYPQEIISENLSFEKVQAILNLLTTIRAQTDFLYYTATKPGNPLYDKPIIDIGEGMFQVFEVKQVIHAVEKLLEKICTSTVVTTTKYVEKKGKLLEERVVMLFTDFLGKDCKIFQGYYVDSCEQDVLILWKKYAFILEAKGYSLREPLRDPNRAFVRIKDDFEECIGYGFIQTRRIEKKFIDGVSFQITDKNGKIIADVDTTQYEYDFSIIVNIKSFGQIQYDLSTLLQLENEDDVYPWAIKLDDLEVFLLTLKAQGKNPIDLVNYLLMREGLHGKLICSDEMEICGGFLEGKINDKIEESSKMIITNPDLSSIFDKQYVKGMGFKNERLLAEKKSGKYLFW